MSPGAYPLTTERCTCRLSPTRPFFGKSMAPHSLRQARRVAPDLFRRRRRHSTRGGEPFRSRRDVAVLAVRDDRPQHAAADRLSAEHDWGAGELVAREDGGGGGVHLADELALLHIDRESTSTGTRAHADPSAMAQVTSSPTLCQDPSPCRSSAGGRRPSVLEADAVTTAPAKRRMIVEALVVRKLSAEEAYLDFGFEGFLP